MYSKGISLRTQFYALIVAMTFLAFTASLVNSIYTLRDYLNDQLSSHAQDAAHNLGLAISSQGANDVVLIQTLAKSIFDSGYYQQITYTAANGNDVVNLQHNSASNVPAWFARWFALKAPLMESEIFDGWIMHGVLKVQSHTGLAEQSLYKQSQRNFVASLVLFLLSAIAIHFILQAILKPLQLIVQQAMAVSRKEFKQNPLDTKTPELKTVLVALNSMVKNIARVFSEQSLNAEQLIQQVYRDPLTALPNRRALMDQLSGLQKDAQINRDGLFVALLNLPSLKSVNLSHGYSAGDDYVRYATTQLQQLEQSVEQLRLFRISGAEFVLVAPCDKTTAAELDQQIARLIASHESSYYADGFLMSASVLAQADEPFGHLLSRLDLAQAQKSLHLPTADNVQTALNHSQWADLIDKILHLPPSENNALELLLLPVFDADNKPLYAESLIRFIVDGEPLPTAEVIGMANRLNRGEELERHMLSFLMHNLPKITNGAVAINICTPTLSSDALYEWLIATFELHHKELPNLLVEIPEHVIFNLPERAKHFIDSLKKLNIKIVVERFGGNLASLKHIQDLNIDYVKIDPSFTQDLQNDHNKFILMALTQICHSVGVKVLAAHLENPQCIAACKAMFMDGFQGFGLCRTVNLTALEKNPGAKTANMLYTLEAILALHGDTKHVN